MEDTINDVYDVDERGRLTPVQKYRLMFSKQLKDVPTMGNYGKIGLSEIKRLELNIYGNFFSDECAIYKGEQKEGGYSAITYNNKKVSVVKLLYHNYVRSINENDVYKKKCKTKYCVTLSHMEY
jgi:hypothetical protein